MFAATKMILVAAPAKDIFRHPYVPHSPPHPLTLKKKKRKKKKKEEEEEEKKKKKKKREREKSIYECVPYKATDWFRAKPQESLELTLVLRDRLYKDRAGT